MTVAVSQTSQNVKLRVVAPALALLAITLSGCSSETTGAALSVTSPARGAMTGRVMGGQQPVSNASIQLWAVNTTGAAATSLLTSTVTTDANGNFSLSPNNAPLYSCPTSTTQVYLLALGGNPGLSSGTNNGALALMAALGSCGSLSPSTNIVINEVTTVASVWALQQFIGVSEGTAFAEDIAVGTTSQSALGMANAFSTVPNLVTISSGTATPTVSNATIESSKINTIANILASCINSDGTTACQALFAAVTPSGSLTAGDTIQAALYMATHPANNLSGLFALQSSSAPFQPALAAAPFDWTLSITYKSSGLNIPYMLGIDASGDIWIGNSAGGANNSVAELSPAGQPVAGSPFLTGSSSLLSSPQSIVPDTVGKIWVVNSGTNVNGVVAYMPSGNTHVTYPAISGCTPHAMAVDGKNDIFYPCYGNSTNSLYELTNLGTTASPVYSTATAYGVVGSSAEGMAIDTSNNVWVANYGSDTITEYAAGSYGSVANSFTTASGARGIAVDHSGNVWASTTNVLYQYVKGSSGYTANTFTGAGLNSPRFLAIDGSGNIWITNGNTTTLNGTTYVTVSEFSNAGLAISPGLGSTVPGGYAHVTTAASPNPRGMAIDPSGNVWVTGCGLSSACSNTGDSFVMELVGAATPVVTPLAAGIANNQLGCCSFTPVAPTGTSPTNSGGMISLQASSYAPDQNTGQFAFLVTRAGGSKGAVTAAYTTIDGTAKAGTDYTTTSGTLTWADGDSSTRTITVPYLDSTNFSGSRTFMLSLNTPTNGATISPIQSTVVTLTDNLTPPSTKFAFYGSTVSWNLQLPIDIYGGTGGTNGATYSDQQVAASQVASGFSDPYFYLNSSNAIVFTAPSNGATTSPGSGTDDARSELRELYSGTGADSNSDWNSSIGGTLTATCTVNATSVDSSEATIGQIHGQTEPFVLLEYRPASNDVAVSILTTNTAGSGGTVTSMAQNISLGTAISYKLQYSGSTLTVTVNGNTQSFAIDSSWTGTGMYFKIGAYSGAPNINNPTGDQTQVAFSSFGVSHP
jgi:hypothetical protein